jgi:hypothetical protein
MMSARRCISTMAAPELFCSKEFNPFSELDIQTYNIPCAR